MSWTCPNCGVSCSAGRRKCTAQLQDTEAQDFAGLEVGGRRHVGLLATGMFVLEKLVTDVELRGGWSARLHR